jgi:transglutaminase-like putative cysteine protease
MTMYLERLLQINMGTLAALGALLLGMGQRSEGTPLIVAAAAAISLWVTDINGWFRLGRRGANVLTLLAVAVSLPELFPLASELQALGFARFLVYLQVILLFQEKDERVYWLLALLSLLQVIVATLFSQGVWFGLLLVIYMLLGFFALTLLLLHRQWEYYRPHHKSPDPGPGVEKHRWPLTGRRGEFTAMPGGNIRPAIGDALVGRLSRMGLHTLALTCVLFFAVPRFDQFAWRGPIAGSQSVVGFSDKVALGELGHMIESRDEVLRVKFYEGRTDVPQPVHGEIYLQGALLTNYQHGEWQTGKPTLDRFHGIAQIERAQRFPSGLVRQEITIKGLDREELFYVAPYVPLRSRFYINVDRTRQRLLRNPEVCSRTFSYELGTTAIVDGVQKPLVPAKEWDSTVIPTGDGADALPNLVALARRWIAESGLPEEDRVGRARYIEQQLAASGRFKYSLARQPRNPGIDLIEDFLTEHPEGHCEYFATALTLMLRSQGIPARMVLGFKSDEWNDLGGYYQVRQLHAHAWVEAYLEPSQIPPDLLHGKDYWPWSRWGGWLQLDPTPASAINDQAAGWLAPLRRGMQWLDFAWSHYIVELNCERQRNAIYRPIADAVRTIAQRMSSPDWWRAVFHAIRGALQTSGVRGIASWLLLTLSTLAGLALLAILGRLVWLLGRRLRTLWLGNHAAPGGRRRVEVEFYRRFENLVARRGMVRPPGQTQREFAAAVGNRLAEAVGPCPLASLPELIAEAYYRVRFGRQGLDNSQAQAVEHALAELAADCSPL